MNDFCIICCVLTLLLAPATCPPALHAGTVGGGLEEPRERQAEIYHTREEKKKAGLAGAITDRILFSGLLEIDALYENLSLAEEDEKSSGLELATAQLGFEAAITDQLGATLVLVYEEGGTGIDVDEATIDFAYGGWNGRLGRQDLPNAIFPSHMISGPLTEELGGIQATALRGGFKSDTFEVVAFAANGDIDEEGSGDNIDEWGVRVTAHPAVFFEIGAGYFSDLAESDAEPTRTLTEAVGGWSVAVIFTAGDFEILGEFLGAAERFDADDLDADENAEGDRPRAWNTEIAWEASDILEVAARIEGSGEFAGEPELQYGGCISWSPWEHISLSFDYLRGEFDENFGDGAQTRDLLTSQLAVEF